MKEEFFNLSEDKQNKIINAAIEEFTRLGYAGASTNSIVLSAGISKGLLFHYFKNKKTLYLDLYDICIDSIIKDFYDKFDNSETDFFAKLNMSMKIKIGLVEKYPSILDFVQTAYIEENPEVKTELKKRSSDLINDSYRKMFANIDVNKFRSDLDLDKVLKTVTWTVERYGDDAIRKAKNSGVPVDYDTTFKEAEGFIKLFKQCFYK